MILNNWYPGGMECCVCCCSSAGLFFEHQGPEYLNFCLTGLLIWHLWHSFGLSAVGFKSTKLLLRERTDRTVRMRWRWTHWILLELGQDSWDIRKSHMVRSVIILRELKTPAGGRHCAVHSGVAADPYFIFLIGFYAVGCFIHPLTYYFNFYSKRLDYRFTDYFDNEIQLFNIVNSSFFVRMFF